MYLPLLSVHLFLPWSVFYGLINTSDYLRIISHRRLSGRAVWCIYFHVWISWPLRRIKESWGWICLAALSLDVVYLVVILLRLILSCNMRHFTLACLRTWLRCGGWEAFSYQSGHFLLLYLQSSFSWNWTLISWSCMFLGEHAKLLLRRQDPLRSDFLLELLLFLFVNLLLLLWMRRLS